MHGNAGGAVRPAVGPLPAGCRRRLRHRSPEHRASRSQAPSASIVHCAAERSDTDALHRPAGDRSWPRTSRARFRGAGGGARVVVAPPGRVPVPAPVSTGRGLSVQPGARRMRRSDEGDGLCSRHRPMPPDQGGGGPPGAGLGPDLWPAGPDDANCANVYGPWQFPDRLIPLMILNGIEEREMPVFGHGRNMRDWLHVEDLADGVWKILQDGRSRPDLQCRRQFRAAEHRGRAAHLRPPGRTLPRLRRPAPADPPCARNRAGAHRAATPSMPAGSAGNWAGGPSRSFDRGLAQTVDWFIENTDWWRRHPRRGPWLPGGGDGCVQEPATV